MAQARAETLRLRRNWTPLPGPQTTARDSLADELLYGGQAGGGKTDLIIGLPLGHTNSIIFRDVYPNLKAIIKRGHQIFGRDAYNVVEKEWRHKGMTVSLGYMQREVDKESYRGQPFDLMQFDEVTEFSESQYTFVTAWNRSTVPGQRCRIVATCNPPTTEQGRWVIRRWAPWVDVNYKGERAAPGELRWFTTIDGVDTEVPDGNPFTHKGETLLPMSRTFIPAALSDNPYLASTGYRARLMAQPEPLRSQLLTGDFSIGISDDEWQVIPSAWIDEAAARQNPRGVLQAVGLDPSRGGEDNTVATGIFQGVLAQEIVPGRKVTSGAAALGVALKLGEGVAMAIDPVGIGSAVIDAAKMSGLRPIAVNPKSPTDLRSKNGMIKFADHKTASVWFLRELLEPGPDAISIPDDPLLKAELRAFRWRPTSTGIALRDTKEQVKQRLGRSPDRAESAFLAALARRIAGGVFIRSDIQTEETPSPRRQDRRRMQGARERFRGKRQSRR